MSEPSENDMARLRSILLEAKSRCMEPITITRAPVGSGYQYCISNYAGIHQCPSTADMLRILEDTLAAQEAYIQEASQERFVITPDSASDRLYDVAVGDPIHFRNNYNVPDQDRMWCPLCDWDGTDYRTAGMSGPVCPGCDRKGILQPYPRQRRQPPPEPPSPSAGPLSTRHLASLLPKLIDDSKK